MWNRIKQFFENIKNRMIVRREMTKFMATALPLLNEMADNTGKWVSALNKISTLILQSEPEYLIGTLMQNGAEILNTTEPVLMRTLTYIFSLSAEDIGLLFARATIESNPQSAEEIRAEKASDVNDVQDMG